MLTGYENDTFSERYFFKISTDTPLSIRYFKRYKTCSCWIYAEGKSAKTNEIILNFLYTESKFKDIAYKLFYLLKICWKNI